MQRGTRRPPPDGSACAAEAVQTLSAAGQNAQSAQVAVVDGGDAVLVLTRQRLNDRLFGSSCTRTQDRQLDGCMGRRACERPDSNSQIHAHVERLLRVMDAEYIPGVQLRAALEAFERLRAEPWAERARAELRCLKP
jgi:hypothetical protein